VSSEKTISISIGLLFTILLAVVGGTWAVSRIIHSNELEKVELKQEVKFIRLNSDFESKEERFEDIINELRVKLSASQSNVSFTVNNEWVTINRDEILITESEARDLIANADFLIYENIIFPDLRAYGYEFKDEMRLRQLLDYLVKDEIPLPEKDNPDDETDPLWWAKCWSFLEDNYSRGIVIAKMPLASVDKAVETFTKDPKKSGLSYLEQFPSHIKSLFLTAYFIDGKECRFDKINFSEGLLFAEGEFEFLDNTRKTVYQFTFLSFEYERQIYTIYLGLPKTDQIIDPSWGEMRDVIKKLKIVKQ